MENRNRDSRPFAWTKAAEEILDSLANTSWVFRRRTLVRHPSTISAAPERPARSPHRLLSTACASDPGDLLLGPYLEKGVYYGAPESGLDEGSRMLATGIVDPLPAGREAPLRRRAGLALAANARMAAILPPDSMVSNTSTLPAVAGLPGWSHLFEPSDELHTGMADMAAMRDTCT
jgi:hypothetical protein